jgi:DNA-directed RNA polymerase specialized sigma24 family protein
MSQPEAAEVLGVSAKTVQRRLVRCLTMLATRIGDVRTIAGSNDSA